MLSFFGGGAFWENAPHEFAKNPSCNRTTKSDPSRSCIWTRSVTNLPPQPRKKKKKKVEKEKLGKYPRPITSTFFFFFVNPYSRIGLPLIYFFSLLLILTVKISWRLVFLFECRLVCPAIYLLLLKNFFYQIPSPSARPSECSPAFPPNLSVSTNFLVQISYRVRVLLWFPPNLFVPLILCPRFRCDQCTPVKVLTWSAPDLSFPVNILEQISTRVVYPFNLPPIHPLLLIFFTRSPRVYCHRSITFLVCHRSICYAKLLD